MCVCRLPISLVRIEEQNRDTQVKINSLIRTTLFLRLNSRKYTWCTWFHSVRAQKRRVKEEEKEEEEGEEYLEYLSIEHTTNKLIFKKYFPN